MKGWKWYEPLVWILGIEAAGFLSASLSGEMGTVYAMLAKPPLAPPGWLFAAVWPVLYALLALAAWRVHRRGAREGTWFWFWVQLGGNLAWSPLFFHFRLFWAAALLLLGMILLTAWLLRAFARLDRVAAWLFAPYLPWLLYAWYLNLGVAWLA